MISQKLSSPSKKKQTAKKEKDKLSNKHNGDHADQAPLSNCSQINEEKLTIMKARLDSSYATFLSKFLFFALKQHC